MKQVLLAVIMAALLLTACGAETQDSNLSAEFAVTLVGDLNKGAFDKAACNAYSAEQLEDMWLEMAAVSGSMRGILSVDTGETGTEQVVVRVEHTNRIVVYTVGIEMEENGGISLLSLQISLEDSKAAAADLPDGIIEEDIVVGQDSGYPLNAKLTLPANIPDGMAVPAVVLVHDAGPWDMDASIFDNKPFRDIAYYLAANGVAVLRYDKITYAYPDDLERLYGTAMTVNLETIYDAIYARMSLSGDMRIDQGKVFVLGHGMGGSLAAEICERGGYNGYISMAGSPRTLAELAYDRAMYAWGDEITDDMLAELDRMIDLYLALDDMQYVEAADASVFGMSGFYLKFLIDYPTNDYLACDVPSLFLQGTNDFNTFFDRDFELYHAFLVGMDAEFRLYEGLNHLFMWSTMPKPDIRDYIPASHVEETVLRDIVEWVKNK